MAIIESAGITDVGKKRKGNEDSLLLDDDQRLYVVADGMGGHQAGEVASKLVVETIRDYMKRFKDEGEAEELDDSDETLSREANRLLAGIKLANNVVHNVSHTKNIYSGMGSTVSAVYFTDETLICANVGDSPIYLIRNKNIELLSTTHNLFSDMAALDPDSATQISPGFKHILTRAMGTQKSVKADICEIRYFKEDILVISSDGLSNKVSQEEILDIANKERPDKACRSLVDLANKRGGDDNITVIALNVKAVNNTFYH
ncbi:MAG: PPM family protein phosphatase [Desulfobacteraceae bacterium Eth-SRB1]|nr:MAG: PPM family protein phosphatase [Desulfobacteraceae bacterium Eth-SRB1]